MNTPNPCCKCKNLYCNVLFKDDPGYECECNLNLVMGVECENFISSETNEFISLSDEFYKIFKMRLRDFVRPVLGFDVILFDSRLNVSMDESTIDFVRREYGEDGVSIIERILKYEKRGGFLQ